MKLMRRILKNDKKIFKPILVTVSVFVYFLLICYILYLKSQIKRFDRCHGWNLDHSLYYTYLSIARDEWQLPEKVIMAMGIQSGANIADIGAGSGYFTFKFARAVGPTGKVYALEINDLAIQIMKEIVNHSRMKGVNFDNVKILKSKKDSIAIDREILDIAFICDLHFYRYENIDNVSTRLIKSIYESLKKDGRLIVIEKYERDRDNTLDIEIVKRHFEVAGFKFKEYDNFLPLQAFLVFEK